MAEELRELRLAHQIPAKDMVAVVQTIYPKYDKTIQSKCENGDAYGVTLRPDAMDALYEHFAPGLKAAILKRKRDRHKLTCRVSARLESSLYAQLQQRMEADGYTTAQEWITAMALRYVQGEESEV